LPDGDLFRRLFEKVVARCIVEGLVGGEHFAVDASIIRANANKQNATPVGEWPTEKITRTEEYGISTRLRKKVEMLFAHLKRIL